ncbi:hypothetical protein E3U43_000406 [Larimichthys crocea]|uniref:Uncharacterized protein n=1 Tax=Larimichthys crocea TaxID=215358 RepID=A0ACD3Q8D1_LARCR|nr:hypothetical protein E3U43_000406 [Larimichthys crocea]
MRLIYLHLNRSLVVLKLFRLSPTRGSAPIFTEHIIFGRHLPLTFLSAVGHTARALGCACLCRCDPSGGSSSRRRRRGGGGSSGVFSPLQRRRTLYRDISGLPDVPPHRQPSIPLAIDRGDRQGREIERDVSAGLAVKTSQGSLFAPREVE